MFRDLKEYQDIAKIYAEKVSKPENLEERRGTELSKDQIQKNREGFKNTIMTGNPEGKKPVNTSQSNRQKLTQQRQKQNKGRVEKQFGFLKTKPSSEFQGRKSRSSQNMQGKPKPEPEYKPEKGVVFGQRTNEVGAQGGGKPSSGDLSMFKDKEAKPLTNKQKFDAKFIKKDKGVGFVRRGTPGAQRAENKEKNKMRAQEMAKKRIADKKAGNASPQLSAKERAQQMAKDRLAKKATMEENAEVKASKLPINKDKNFKTGYTSTSADGIPIQNFGNPKDTTGYYSDSLGRATKFKNKPIIPNPFEKKDKNTVKSSYEYDAYDYVLEYLLSSEQAATIEEANYVMTEMDAETIQGIVEEQKKTLDEMDMMKMPVVNVLGGIGSAIAGTVATARYLGRKAGERGIKKEGEKPGKPGLVKTIKDRTDATNKAIEKMNNP